jgi:hypothetical protein
MAAWIVMAVVMTMATVIQIVSAIRMRGVNDKETRRIHSKD